MAVAELLAGARLGPTAEGGHRYEVVNTLGAGGFGITYLARDERLDGEVVVKELACHNTSFRDTATGRVRPIHGHQETHDKLVKRFVREAKLLNRLRSPHIVRVTDVWEERGSAYYAMDKVDFERHLGEALADGVTTRSWTDAKVHALQLLDALEAVHDAGLVHGDVKPANVLVDRRRGVVLIDFGTARADEEFQTTITSTSFTRGYAPPELMHPSRVREAGPWSDVYSWAMVTWELVMPHPGDAGRPVDATARQHGFDPYLDAAGQLSASGMPETWAETLEACIHLEPSRRPRSVADVRAMLNGEPPPLYAAATLAMDKPDLTSYAPDTQQTEGAPTSAATAAPPSGPPSALAPSALTALSPAPGPSAAAANGSGNHPVVLLAAALAFMGIAALGVAAATHSGDDDIDNSPEETIVDAEVDEESTPAEGDACGGCDDGLICISNACHHPHAEEVMDQYRSLLDHWNNGSSKGFFAQYSDPLVCYHNRANLALASLRVLRGQHFATPDGSEFEIDTLAVLASEEDSVVLMDTGRFLAGDGREKPHVRLIEYRNFENRGWRITIEASRTSHGCAADWFE